MIVEEYKIDSTLIRVDNRDIGTNEEEKEIINMLVSLIIKKLS